MARNDSPNRWSRALVVSSFQPQVQNALVGLGLTLYRVRRLSHNRMITQVALRSFRFFESLDFLGDVSASGLGNSVQMRQGTKLRYYGAEDDAPIVLAISISPPNNGHGKGIGYALEFKPAPPYFVSETVDVISAKEPP